MRSVFGILSLLVVLGAVVLLAKKQLPASAASGAHSAAVSPQQQSEETTQQYKKALESAMQRPRSMPEDQKQESNRLQTNKYESKQLLIS